MKWIFVLLHVVAGQNQNSVKGRQSFGRPFLILFLIKRKKSVASFFSQHTNTPTPLLLRTLRFGRWRRVFEVATTYFQEGTWYLPSKYACTSRCRCTRGLFLNISVANGRVSPTPNQNLRNRTSQVRSRKNLEQFPLSTGSLPWVSQMIPSR